MSEMHDVRKSLVEDYELNPQLVRDCSHEIKKHCGGGLHKEGRTVHCLMNLAMSKKSEDNQEMSATCVRTVSHEPSWFSGVCCSSVGLLEKLWTIFIKISGCEKTKRL